MENLAFRPDGRRSCERLLVLLHGYGATQHDIATIGSQVDPDGRFFILCPRGPIEVPGGGASWYDFDDTWRADPKSFAETLDGLINAVSATGALVLAGRDDPNVPLERNRRQAQRLQAAGAEVTMSDHDGSHGLSPAMLTDVARWLFMAGRDMPTASWGHRKASYARPLPDGTEDLI